MVMPVVTGTAVMTGGSVLLRWSAVDDEREDVLHDRLAGGLVLPGGLLDVELERPAARLRLLVDVDELGRPLEDVAHLRPAEVLEGLLAVEDRAAGAAELLDRQSGGAAGTFGAPERHHERERRGDRCVGAVVHGVVVHERLREHPDRAAFDADDLGPALGALELGQCHVRSRMTSTSGTAQEASAGGRSAPGRAATRRRACASSPCRWRCAGARR